MPPLDDHGDIFAALADPHRRAVLERIAAGDGSVTATEIAAGLPISRQAVFKHLRLLHRARLVEGVRRGREVRYRALPGRLAAAGHGLEAVAAGWDDTLAALKRDAEGQNPDPDKTPGPTGAGADVVDRPPRPDPR